MVFWASSEYNFSIIERDISDENISIRHYHEFQSLIVLLLIQYIDLSCCCGAASRWDDDLSCAGLLEVELLCFTKELISVDVLAVSVRMTGTSNSCLSNADVCSSAETRRMKHSPQLMA